MRHRIAIALVVALLGSPTGARADDGAQRVAYGAGSAFGTLVYAPVKASFCILGAIGSGFTYMVDSQTAGKVARGSCGGTWVITPSAVAGKESVHFVGNTAPDSGRSHAAASQAQK
jgi:hypothetical protein